MSERKVLNKYYPPDFDPSKIPRMKLAKNRQYTVRLMAPFNMRCITCGEYIYKGKKFNARKEDVEHEDYLGIRIYRFYIKCTRCLQEISFKTDPKNTDYEIEAGATRNFMALKLAEEQAKREEDELKEEEANNPMKLLENRTEQSRNEIELLESLEELKDLNRRQAAVDYDSMLQQYVGESAEDRRKREEKEDEEFVKSITFKNKSNLQKVIVTEEIIEDVDDDSSSQGPLSKRIKKESDGDYVNTNRYIPSVIQSTPNSTKPPFISKGALKSHDTWNKSIGTLPKRGGLSGLVKLNSKRPSSKNDGDAENLTNSQPLKPQDESKIEKSVVDKSETNVTSTVTSNSLSLLGNYSGSDSNEDD